MKKTLFFALAAMMMLGMASCSKDNVDNNDYRPVSFLQVKTKIEEQIRKAEK